MFAILSRIGFYRLHIASQGIPAITAILIPMQTSKRKLPLAAYRLLLISAAAVWGLGFTIGKSAISIVGATWFTAFRFLGATIVLTLIMWPHVKKHFNSQVLRSGCIIGVASFLGFWSQFIGLEWTTPSKNAFLSACYCITVPFVWWVITKRRPNTWTIGAAAVCTVGIGLVSLTDSLSIGLGDGVSILSAFLYGGEIVIISLALKGNDVITVTVVQQLVAGVLALIIVMVSQPWPTATQLSSPDFLGSMAYVILGSAAFGAIAQNIAQKHIPAAEAGLLCSLESVFCAAFGALFFGEVFTLKMLVGFVLIFTAIIVVQLHSNEPSRSREI